MFNQGVKRKGVIAQDKKSRKLGFYALGDACGETYLYRLDKLRESPLPFNTKPGA